MKVSAEFKPLGPEPEPPVPPPPPEGWGEPGGRIETPKLFVLEAFEDIKFEAREEWLVKRLLPRQGVAVIYGKSQSFKSFVVTDLAWHIASGWEWAGLRSVQCPVVYVAAEGASGLRKRKDGWTRAHRDIPAPLPFRLISDAPNLGSADGDLPRLIASIEAAGIKPGVIILDTLAQTLGSGDENGSGMVQYIANAQALANKFAALVVIVHHVGLTDEQRMRGHSSLHGAIDAQLLCERTKGALSSTMTLQKLKDDASERVFDLSLGRVVVGHDSDGDEVSTLVIEAIRETEAKPTGPARQVVPQQQRLLMSMTAEAIEEAGQDVSTFGGKGPRVRAVHDEAIRKKVYARIAEQAQPDEDRKKLEDRQRKAFNRNIADAIKAQRLMAEEREGRRFIWLPS